MPSPLHPLFVHLPLGLALIMPLLAGGLLLAWWKEWLPRKSWWVVVVVQAALVVGGVAALQTGERDEEAVERIVDERLIEEHEESAEVFVWGAGLVLALCLAGGVIPKQETARLLAAGAVLGSFAVLGFAVRTGQAGGALVYEHDAAHAYVSAAAAAASPGTSAAPPPARHYDDDDDDDDD